MGFMVGIDSATMRILCIMFLVMVGGINSDFDQDKKECQDQLVGLSPCLPFVDGDSKAPSAECCTLLRNDANKTRKCLCILVKDRNEPKLGLKINATLALSLPYICHARANSSKCVDILHLDPNSTDAQVFEQFANTTAGNGNSAVTDTPTSSSSIVRGRGRRWLNLGMIGGISIWFLMPVFFRNI